MKPLLTLGIGALLLLQATGLNAFLAPLPCADGCPEDGPDGNCAPMCDECVCCPALRSCAQPEVVVLLPAASCMTTTAESRVMPAHAAPADIFHVPKHTLA